MAMVLLLLLVAHLALLYSHRALLFEQRASASQIRAVRAQEAAHAGIDWAVSRLNDVRAVDAQCQPIPQPAPPPLGPPASVRTRWERGLAAAAPWRPACRQATDTPGWRCDCPDSGAGRLAADPQVDTPSFALTLQPGSRAGLWSLVSEGCSHPGPDCGGDSAAEPDGRYRITVVLAPLGQVVQAPLAALTSLGEVHASGEASVVNADPAGVGTTIHAGGTITLQPPARAVGPPGQPQDAGLVARDPPLTAGEGALWRRLFGLGPATLQALPTWRRLACATPCTGRDLAQAADAGARALWLDGDLTLQQGHWGSADLPLLLVVRGTLRIGADVSLQALVVADQAELRNPGPARSLLQGALVSLGSTTLAGAVHLVRDAALLGRLAGLGSVLAPVPGSWFDPHTR